MTAPERATAGRVDLFAGARIAGMVAGMIAALLPTAVRTQVRDRELEELLVMGLEGLADIEVASESKDAEPAVNAPATVCVITDEQIRERCCLTLEDALADLPGMRFRNTLRLNSCVPEIGLRGANTGVGCRITDRIRVGAWGRYSGGRQDRKVTAASGRQRSAPSFVLNNPMPFLDLGGFGFPAIARNVLDEVYYDPSNVESDRYHQPQRNILA